MSTSQVRERRKPSIRVKIISALLCGFSFFTLNPISASAETSSTANNDQTVTEQALPQSWIVLGPHSRTIYRHRFTEFYAVSGNANRVALEIWQRPVWKVISVKWVYNTGGKATFRILADKTSTYRAATIAPNGAATSFSASVAIYVKSDIGLEVAEEAASHSGAPYAFGAAGPRAFDCSGLTLYVFRKFGKFLPHSATAQSRYGTYVAGSAAKVGDIILFGSWGYFHHVAIYAGGNKMIDAPTYGQTVGVHRIWSRQITFRRLV